MFLKVYKIIFAIILCFEVLAASFLLLYKSSIWEKVYYKENGKVYYFCMQFFNDCMSGEITMADYNTFESIDDIFAKDKKYVYLGGQVIEGADPKTFEINNADVHYVNDAKNVYYLTDMYAPFVGIGGLKNIQEADMASFSVIDSGYSKDKNHVYYKGSKIDQARPGSFEIINEVYSKDSENVYFATEIIDKISDNLVFLDCGFTKDNNYVRKGAKVLDNADTATFEIINYDQQYVNTDCLYAKDKNNVYYFRNGLTENNIIKGADPEKFQVVKYPYSKDANSAFYEDVKINGSDPDTFEVLDTQYDCAKDKNHVYVRDELKEGVDPTNFIPW